MANRLDLDLRNLNFILGKQPVKEIRCESVDSIKASREISTRARQGIVEITSVSLLMAAAAVATMGDAKHLNPGLIAAWLGLVPEQIGTGRKMKLLHISKCGGPYLRTLLIHGARSVLCHVNELGAWIEQI